MASMAAGGGEGMWSFKDDNDEVHGWYDAETIRHWAQEGYLTSETEVRCWEEGLGADAGGFEWLGLVEELTQEGLSESSWYYQVEEGEDAETHGPYGIFILHAWIEAEMLDYDTLRVLCASTGSKAEGDGFIEMPRRSDWDECGVYDRFVLLKDVPNVFSASGDAEVETGVDFEKIEESGGAESSAFTMSGATRDKSALQAKSSVDRKSDFFSSMRAEKQAKERQIAEARKAKLNAMTEEQREAFLAAEEAEAKHAKDKDKMLRKQMKGMKAKGLKKKGKKGRGSRAGTISK